MKAIILAAGRGSRMGNLTENVPKGMVRLAGKMLLEWQMKAIRTAGIGDIIIVRGYQGEAMPFTDVQYIQNKRWQETNMVSSLCEAREYLENSDCVISYSDIIYPANTVSLLKISKGDITITYDVNWYALWSLRFSDPLSDAETFMLDADGRLSEIGNKTGSLNNVQGQYMGLLKFTRKGWKQIQEYLNGLSAFTVDKLDMTGMLKGLLARNIRIDTVPVKEPWLEIDSEKDLKIYEGWIEDRTTMYHKVFNKKA